MKFTFKDIIFIFILIVVKYTFLFFPTMIFLIKEKYILSILIFTISAIMINFVEYYFEKNLNELFKEAINDKEFIDLLKEKCEEIEK